MSKKDKLLKELKEGGLLNQSGGGPIVLTDNIPNTVIPTAVPATPGTTLTTFGNVLDWIRYTGSGVVKLNETVYQGIPTKFGGDTFYTLLGLYNEASFADGEAVRADTFKTPAGTMSGLELYIADQIAGGITSIPATDLTNYYTKTQVYTKSESDGRYTATGTAYTKSESDGKYALVNVSYLKSEVYTKSESDGKYALVNVAYTKSESDGKYALTDAAYTKSVSDGKYALTDAAYTKSESDGKYALVNVSYLKSEVYTKSESDGRYTATGTAYTKSESDGKYALTDAAYTKSVSDGKYALVNASYIKSEVYTKSESDGKYALTDAAYTKSVSDGKYALTDAAYTKSESDGKYALTNAAYTKSETYTKSEIDSKVTSASMTDAAFLAKLLTAIQDPTFLTQLKTIIEADTTNTKVVTISDLTNKDANNNYNNGPFKTAIEAGPLAQFKHLPDPVAFGSFSGGNIVSLADGGSKKKINRSSSPKISIKNARTLKK